MDYVTLSRAAYLWVFIFWLGSCQHVQEQTLGKANTPAQPASATTDRDEHTWPSFALASEEQEDSMKAVFVKESQLTHAFGSFYKTPTGEWVLVHYRFGIPAGEQHIFALTPCPVLDSATFKVDGKYWQDSNGAYYEAIDLVAPHIATIPQADLPTFKALGFEHLAVDKYHVFQLGAILSGLQPATLTVYTPDGQLTEDWDFNQSAYLISGNAIYSPEGQRLAVEQAAHFRLPSGYKLAYPLHHQPTRKGK